MTPPVAPKTMVWLTVFVIIMLAGVASTLLTWPKNEPSGTTWFWIRALFFPVLAWCIAFGLRLHYYNEEADRLQAEDETLATDREEAIRFAGEPLAVLGYTYLSALGSVAVVQGQTALRAQKTDAGEDAIRHTVLTLVGDEESVGRYRCCFMELLGPLAESINALPPRVPFEVRLQLPVNTDQAALLATWQACWQECEFRPAEALPCSAAQGLMMLDEWLDIGGGPGLEKFILLVSVQLYDKPPPNSAEAAVALLLGWAPLAERCGMAPFALMHRPVAVDPAALSDGVSLSLLWGKTKASQIDDLWEAGLEGPDKSALVRVVSDLSFGIAQTDELSGIHDIDVAIGNPGTTAGWLAMALAVEHAAKIGKPQWIASRKNTLWLAIAQPVIQVGDVELKG